MHPGEMLAEEFLNPIGITPSTALRLAKFFGNSPDVWLNQIRCDLYKARKLEGPILGTIPQYKKLKKAG